MKRSLHLFASLGILAAANLAFGIGPSDVKVEGWKVGVAGQSFKIDPPAVQEWAGDVEMKDGTVSALGPVHLPGAAWAFEAFRPETLVATLASDPKVVLEKGKDFAVDDAWGSVASIKGGRAPAGTQVHFAYKYGMSRLDLVESARRMGSWCW